jgi:branched-chain amino acid transport system permease protein
MGYTGYVSFGHVIFFGLGGYMGLFLMSNGASIWLSLAGGGLTAGFIAFLIGRAILRLRGSYFALATIGVNEPRDHQQLEPFGGPTGIH